MCDIVTAFAQAGPAIAIIIAAWAAWEARRAADASKASIEAQIVHSAMTEYFQHQMVSNIRVLRRWRDQHDENFAEKWFTDIKNGNAGAEEVETARREVKGYFVKAARLHSNKLISDSALQAVAYVHGINVFYDIVCPLGLALNPDASTRTEKHLLSHVGRYSHSDPRL